MRARARVQERILRTHMTPHTNAVCIHTPNTHIHTLSGIHGRHTQRGSPPIAGADMARWPGPGSVINCVSRLESLPSLHDSPQRTTNNITSNTTPKKRRPTHRMSRYGEMGCVWRIVGHLFTRHRSASISEKTNPVPNTNCSSHHDSGDHSKASHCDQKLIALNSTLAGRQFFFILCLSLSRENVAENVPSQCSCTVDTVDSSPATHRVHACPEVRD